MFDNAPCSIHRCLCRVLYLAIRQTSRMSGTYVLSNIKKGKRQSVTVYLVSQIPHSCSSFLAAFSLSNSNASSFVTIFDAPKHCRMSYFCLSSRYQLVYTNEKIMHAPLYPQSLAASTKVFHPAHTCPKVHYRPLLKCKCITPLSGLILHTRGLVQSESNS